jgi:hypothetical protein
MLDPTRPNSSGIMKKAQNQRTCFSNCDARGGSADFDPKTPGAGAAQLAQTGWTTLPSQKVGSYGNDVI